MINILITDDEPLIRQSVTLMIREKYSEDSVAIYEASDGQKALELILSVNINILITDIKMPVCSGLELLGKLKKFDFSGRSIVLSGFDDYSLVRDALKLGAADYLLKPLVREEFYSLLDNTIEEIVEQESYLSNHSTEGIIDLKALYSSQYKLDSCFIGDFEPVLSRLSAPLKDMCADELPCTLLLIDLSDVSTSEEAEYSKSSCFNHCNRYFWQTDLYKRGGTTIQGEHLGLWAVLLLNSCDDDYSSIQPLLAEYTKIGKKACCSKIFKLSDLKEAYSDSVRRLDNIFYNMPKITPSEPEAYPYPMHFKALENSADSFNYTAFGTAVHELMLQINYDKHPVNEVKALLQDFIYRLMQKNSKYIRIIGRFKMSENDILIGIENAFCLTECETAFLTDFKLYMADDSADEGAYIRRAKDYIREHFTEDISLNDVAESLSLHPNYFSALFKKSCGMTFMEFLRNLRIEKARELLEHTDLKLYDIAEKTGYNDTVSFSRAFLKSVGMSPGEYRRK